jgi:hypothetical protein
MNQPGLPPVSATTDIPCSKCGYNLHGLDPKGVCPECGAPISESMVGRLLVFSAPDYVASLHRGVFLIVTVILLQFLASFVGFGAVLALQQGAVGASVVQTVVGTMQLGQLALSVALWVGWWMFSAPDPAVRTGMDSGDKPRQWVRIAVAASAIVTLITTISEFVGAPPVAAPIGKGGPAGAAVVGVLIGLFGLAVTAVKFFASMMYLGWLGPRLPDPAVVTKARSYMWQLPIWTTVGALLCGLGPLIALVLYWNLLDQVRKDLKRVREEQARPV